LLHGLSRERLHSHSYCFFCTSAFHYHRTVQSLSEISKLTGLFVCLVVVLLR
jgi:hypothetical protein